MCSDYAAGDRQLQRRDCSIEFDLCYAMHRSEVIPFPRHRMRALQPCLVRLLCPVPAFGTFLKGVSVHVLKIGLKIGTED